MNTIKSANLQKNIEIVSRRLIVNDKVRSIHVNQLDGSFVTTEPQSNIVKIYPQNPNTAYDTIKEFSTFNLYGSLSQPLDAKFDFTRNKLWIADTGNQRVLRINPDTSEIETEITDISFPYSIAVNINDDTVFIKSFEDTITGSIHHYNNAGEEISNTLFQQAYPYSSLTNFPDINYEDPRIKTSSMVFDHTHHRLWWVAYSTYIYMFDVRNKQIISNDLSDAYKNLRSIDVDFNSGNIFILCSDMRENDWIIQINRDNNQILGGGYVDEVPTNFDVSSTSFDIPEWLRASGFSNPYMNGNWIESESHYYHEDYNNLLSGIAGSSGIFTNGRYEIRESGNVWVFTIVKSTNFPEVEEFWQYSLQKDSSAEINGTYTLEAYRNRFNYAYNYYQNDFGNVVEVVL